METMAETHRLGELVHNLVRACTIVWSDNSLPTCAILALTVLGEACLLTHVFIVCGVKILGQCTFPTFYSVMFTYCS